MDRLGKETGGAAFDASEKSVSKALAEVSEELRAMYGIGYMRTQPNRGGPGYFAR